MAVVSSHLTILEVLLAQVASRSVRRDNYVTIIVISKIDHLVGWR